MAGRNLNQIFSISTEKKCMETDKRGSRSEEKKEKKTALRS